MHTPELSIVVPYYNEERYLKKSITALLQAIANYRTEIILVDDHSADQSFAVATEMAADYDCIKLIRHPRNLGKGAALRSGFQIATGDVVTIHDADLEYDPKDLVRMYHVFCEQNADMVIGSRFFGNESRRVLYFQHQVANKVLTFLSNIFTDLNVSDMESCYKMFRRALIQNIELCEERFGIEPEILAKIAKYGRKSGALRIYEVGISYHGRTYEEGKKIRFIDAVRAIYCIFRYNLFK